MDTNSPLISPYGGELVDLMVDEAERPDVFEYAAALRSIQLSQRETCDLELLATGAFSPLRTFMGERDLRSVIADMRLADGTVFPIPVTLSVNDPTNIAIGSAIALRDAKNDLLAVLDVERSTNGTAKVWRRMSSG